MNAVNNSKNKYTKLAFKLWMFKNTYMYKRFENKDLTHEQAIEICIAERAYDASFLNSQSL